MKVKLKLSVFQKRRTTKCNPRTVAPASAVCAAFAARPRRVPTGSKKPDVAPTCGSAAEMANAEEGGLATSQQIISKTSITRSAAEYKLLSRCRCPFGRWLFLCRRKNFQNRLFKTQFSVGLNRRTFSEGRKQAAQARKCKRSVNFLEKASKNRVPVAYAVRGFFRGTPLKTQNSVGSNRGSYR